MLSRQGDDEDFRDKMSKKNKLMNAALAENRVPVVFYCESIFFKVKVDILWFLWEVHNVILSCISGKIYVILCNI